ncbi:MAG: glycosyltransferase [Aliifodinibius sp.]|nr:glycosyltransferase family 4 protein [Fodinibius sp.]NIY27640.1 glycosyltransferase [Fodinibius sp.]
MPNINLHILPVFNKEYDGYLKFFQIQRQLAALANCDLVNVRLPTLHGILGYKIAKRLDKPIFSSIVGDIKQTIATNNYTGLKKLLGQFVIYHHEKTIDQIIRNVPTVTNGRALYSKFQPNAFALYQTVTTTLTKADIQPRVDTCQNEVIHLLFVGQVIEAKGVPLLISTLSQLVNTGIRIHLNVVGDGKINQMKKIAQAQQISQHITFWGHLNWGPTLFEQYRQADIFVFPTNYGEGTPRVILEAMANGLPVIASNIAGIPDVISHYYNGILVNPNCADELQRQILNIINDGQLRKNLIAAALKTAYDHTLDHQTKTMLQNLAPHFPKLAKRLFI